MYITDYGSMYHLSDCGSLWKSRHSISLVNAVSRGYTPCSRCSAPIYTGVIPTEPPETKTPASKNKEKNQSNRSSNSSDTFSSKDSYTAGTIIFVVLMSPFAIFFAAPFLSGLCSLIASLWRKLPPYKKKLARIEAVRKKEQARLESERQKVLMQKIIAKRAEFQDALYSLYEGFYLFSEECEELASSIAKKSEATQQRLSRILSEHNAIINQEHKICTLSDGKHYGDSCTIYFNPSASCYHRASCTYRGTKYAHILSPPTNKRPCRFCKPSLIDVTWVKECAVLYDNLQRLQQLTNATHYSPHQFSRFIDAVIHLYCRVGKLYAPPDSSQESFLMTAANGMQVWVPADKLEAWETAQADQSNEAEHQRELTTAKILEYMEKLRQERINANNQPPKKQ